MDSPYYIETHHVPTDNGYTKIAAYKIRSSTTGFFCQTDQFWKARVIVDALNAAVAKPKEKIT